jgi:hypothetical protein
MVQIVICLPGVFILTLVTFTRTNLVAGSKVTKSGTDFQVILCIKESINCQWIAESYEFLSRGVPFCLEMNNKSMPDTEQVLEVKAWHVSV